MRASSFVWVSALSLCFASPHEAAAEEAARILTTWDLATIRDLGGLSLSPDGVWVAFQVRQADPYANRYETAWYVVPTNGGDVRRIADAGEPFAPSSQGRVNGFIITPPPVWSPDSAWIVFVRKEGGRTQIWRAGRDGRQVQQLTHNEGDVRTGESGVGTLAFSRDGRRLLFEIEPSAAQIESVRAHEGRIGFVYDRRFFPSYSPLPVLPADVVFAADHRSEEEANARRIWVYDFDGRRERPATVAEQSEFVVLTATPKPMDRPSLRESSMAAPGGGVASSRDGALAWTEALDPKRQGGAPPLTIVAQLSATDTPIVCAAVECTSQSIRGIWWRSESQIVFARGEGLAFRETALYAWRPGESAPILILRTPDTFTSQIEWNCAVSQDRLICFYERPNYPRRLVAIHLDSGIVDTLHDPNPQFARLDLGPPPQLIEIRAASGVETYGYLVLPPYRHRGERLPLVIATYRCSGLHGFLRGGIGDEYPIYPFAAHGFAVMCFNVPEPDFERLARLDWIAYGNWMRGPGDPVRHRVQEGLDAAVAQLEAMGIIDPEKVGLTGLSFGAETVSFALFNMGRLNTAIASGTEIGPSSPFLYGPAGREILRAWGLASPTSDRWHALSLSLNADQVRAPLLLNVPDHELLNALETITALQDAGREVEMYVFPDEYHIKSQPAHRLAIYERNIDWMNFWLRGVEVRDPTKVAQYERWRSMRENMNRLGRASSQAGQRMRTSNPRAQRR